MKVDLARLTVIVGPNGCGKSTLLDQIEVLCGCSQVGTEERHVLGLAGEVLKSLHPPTLPTNGFDGPMYWMGSDAAGSEFSITGAPGTEPDWYNRFDLRASASGRSLTKTAASQGAEKHRDFFELLRSSFSWRAQRLRLVPRDIAMPVDVRNELLDPSGFGLASILTAFALNDQDGCSALKADMRAIVQHFERLNIARGEVGAEQGGRVGGVALGMVMRGAGRQPATAISDGTLLALALLTATHNKDMPPIVLMDDIDHGLHLGAQVALVKAIRRVMEVRPDLQVICTTHSPFLLQEVPPEDVRVMAFDGAGHSRVRPLTEHPEYARWSKVMNTGEVWANLGEDWVVDGA